MRTLARTLALLLCLAFMLPAYGWWDEGHMLINRAAAMKAPRSMPLFFRNATARLTYLGPEPDRWKTGGATLYNSESPEHYMNMEMLDGTSELPLRRFDYYKLIATKKAAEDAAGVKPVGKEELTPDNVGTQPYAAMEVYGRLVVAFREYRRLLKDHQPTVAAEQDAVMYAGWLGHYVGDGAQPLHTTVNYNGWVTENPNQYSTDHHLHAKFEGEFVQRNLKKLAIAGLLHDPSKLDRPFADYVQYLRDSNAQVEKLYQLDKAKAFDGDGSAEGVEFVRQRMAAGAQMLVDMWYTAWLESAVEPQRHSMPAATPAGAATPRPSAPPPPGAKP